MSIKRALRRVIEETQCQKILLPFEGNSWESGAVRAAKEKHITSVGYQHTALPDEMTKLSYEVHEDQLPDYVMTSGAGATDRLISHFQMPEDRLITGVSFRKNLNLLILPIPEDGYVLVLLQGLDSDRLLMECITQVLEPIDTRVRVRTHPACPIHVSTMFDVSEGTTLEADISGASICLYGGTSACIEALLSGVPVIHIDCGLYPSLDPLSFMPPTPLKQDWHSGQDLKEMIKNMISIDSARRQEYRVSVIEFIHYMFTPATLNNTQELSERIIQETNLP
ncbi:MAG: hypothetical protein J0L77_08780 [Alphaproteobacteria bacterium]|nr:hypothetical protein [Alphaproteobacteria bacterium]